MKDQKLLKFTLRLTENQTRELEIISNYYKNSKQIVFIKLLDGAFLHLAKSDPLFFGIGGKPQDKEEKELLKLEKEVFNNTTKSDRVRIAESELIEEQLRAHRDIKAGADPETIFNKSPEQINENMKERDKEKEKRAKIETEAYFNKPHSEYYLNKIIGLQDGEQDQEEEPEALKPQDPQERVALIKELEEEKDKIEKERAREEAKFLKRSNLN